jgi:hypothetical protein
MGTQTARRNEYPSNKCNIIVHHFIEKINKQKVNIMSYSDYFSEAEMELREGITGYCRNCDKPLRGRLEEHHHRGEKFCEECFEALRTHTCDCCGSPILDGDDMLEADGWIFCEDCMEKERHCCEICGSLIVDGDKAIIFEYHDRLKGKQTFYICDDCGKRKREVVPRSDAI